MADNILRAGPIPYKHTRWEINKPNAVTVADCYITVDVDAVLRAIGYKALHNKKHITQLQGGAVIVEAVNIRKEA
jgi:hypothetical protein